MSQPALYDFMYVRVDGKLMSENQAVSTSLEEDISQVKTIPKGFSGITPGSPVRMVTLKNPVPVSGFEYDWEVAMLSHRVVEIELTLGGSGLKTISKGFIIGPIKVDSDIGKNTDSDIQFVGTAAPFA